MGREAASHIDRQQRELESLRARVRELERDCVQLLYERDKARATAAHYEEIFNQVAGPRNRGFVEHDRG